MNTAEEVPSRRGVRRGLDRELIVSAAIRSIDLQGAQGLTMRGLGQDLGVEAMSLYRYVTGKEDVLEAVVGRLLQGIPDVLEARGSPSWQAYLQTLAHAVRDIAARHPLAFPLIATRHPAAPWLRPPLRSLEIVEHFLQTLGGFGFTDDQLAGTYRSFSSFLLGNLLLQSATQGADTSLVGTPVDEGDAQIPNTDGEIELDPDSHVFRLRPKLSEDHSAEEFEAALETLLDRLELQLSQ